MRRAIFAAIAALALAAAPGARAQWDGTLNGKVPFDTSIFDFGTDGVFIKSGGIGDAMLGLSTPALGAPTATGGTLSGTVLADTINQQFEVSSATLTKTSDTSLAAVSGLAQALTAGKTYSCRGHLTGAAGASGGIKAALVASGGLTATSATFTGFAWNGTTAVANTTVTALGSNIVANTAVYSDLWIDGSIVVNAAGTINVEAAQNASNGTATTVLQGSTFGCVRVN